jgi:transglutaminase-like putative cysteine protease
MKPSGYIIKNGKFVMRNNFFSKVARDRWWDSLLVFLLILMFFSAASRLIATNWTEHLSIVQTIALLGVLSGIALGQSLFSPSTVWFFAFAYGAFVIPWQLGLTLGEGIQWSERLLSMMNRMLITLDQLARQKPVTDNLFFLTLMSALFWILALDAGYQSIRHGKSWRSILPTGLTIFIIHAYDPYIPARSWMIAAFLFFSLLFVSRLHYLDQQKQWKKRNSYLPPYLGLDHIRVTLFVTLFLILLAWTFPALASSLPSADEAWRRVSTPWTKIRERMSYAFANLRSSVGFVTDFYGDVLPLGRGTPLSDAIIMTVQAPTRTVSGVRYYWRARVYDHYNGQWTSTLSTVRSLSPQDFDLNQPKYEGRLNYQFIIKTFHSIQNLYTPAEPVWVSRPVQAHLSIYDDGTTDLGFLIATPYLHAGEMYQVESSLTAATIKQLRSAGTDYPQWVTSRYLQLPDTITPRTRQLAAHLAAGLDNPYDIAETITNYLRENLSYAESIPSPPNDQEPLDWVLFEHKQAFCNYYASIEVIMLRSLGIPARLAVGYAEGQRIALGGPETVPTLQALGENIPREIDYEQELYIVRHRDAHAWPEVYFPGIGWVEFEPTASQAPLLRPTGNFTIENSMNNAQREEDFRRWMDQRNQSYDESELFREPFNSSRGRITPFYWLTFGLIMSVLVWLIRKERMIRGSPPLPVQIESSLRRIGLKPPRFLRRWSQYASLPQHTRAYIEINRALTRLHAPPKISDTPLERAFALKELLPSAENSIHRLVTQYHLAIYLNRPLESETIFKEANDIRWQSYLALFKRWFAHFQEPQPIPREQATVRKN